MRPMKRFGKLRQWTDEKLGASQRTLATEEFREMEAEMQTREQGLVSIEAATTIWMKALGKKKEGHDKEKGIPLELLGIALFQHGDDFATDSAYGQALSRFGIAQQKIARLQETFQRKVSENVVTNMQRSLATMKDCQAARKRLESRRLTYDLALNKVQKAKKEDSKLEEELRAAKIRYEESIDDVQKRMISIREAEANNLHDVSDFIEAQSDYFEHARDVMLQLRNSVDEETGKQEGSVRPRKSSICPQVHQDEPFMPLPRRVLSQSTVSAVSLPDLAAEKVDRYQGRRAYAPGMSMLTNELQTMSQESLNNDSRSSSSSSIEDPRTQQAPLTFNRLNSLPAGPRCVSKKVKANFSFDAEAPNELSIRTGDVIQVLEEVSEGWWDGYVLDESGAKSSQTGLFPANYCSPFVSESTVTCRTTSPRRSASTQAGGGLDTTSGTRSHTFPRDRRLPSALNSAAGGSHRNKPPPPPVPKKKQNLTSSIVL